MNASRNRRISGMLVTVAVCALTGVEPKAQTAYTYTVIADLYNCSASGTPVINNSGQVAFVGRCGAPLGTDFVILRGDGGALTTIYSWDAGSGTQHVPQLDAPSMNDNGVVTFAVNGPCPNGGATAIWTSDGGSIDVVHDICTQPGFTSVIRPSISNSGAVAFMAASGNGYDFVVRVKNGVMDTIAGPGTSTTSLGTLTAALEPAINNNDVVTFTGQGLANFGLFTGAGGPLTTISLNSPSGFNGIDDSGRVAFVAASMAVQTGDGGPVTTIATRTFEGGAYQSFAGAGAAISAAGKVAFLAYLPTGQIGVFTGPDPVADVVLKAGDVIPGWGTVTAITILREAINDSGQVAMNVRFDDAGVAKAAIIRADPPNTPPTASDANISVASGASVSGTLSGSDPDGEPFTFALVSNGSKGSAVLDNASTGAFTYTANAGTSGDDTFTFQVTDSRGLTSNIATMTVAIESACAVDVTSSIQPVKGRGTKDTSTTQTLTLSNNSTAALAGPISLVLDSLSPAGTTLVNAAGVTSCTTPAGSPYVNVDVGADSIWSPGERVQVVLEFSATTAGRGKPSKITYVRRVLAGAGER